MRKNDGWLWWISLSVHLRTPSSNACTTRNRILLVHGRNESWLQPWVKVMIWFFQNVGGSQESRHGFRRKVITITVLHILCRLSFGPHMTCVYACIHKYVFVFILVFNWRRKNTTTYWPALGGRQRWGPGWNCRRPDRFLQWIGNQCPELFLIWSYRIRIVGSKTSRFPST